MPVSAARAVFEAASRPKAPLNAAHLYQKAGEFEKFGLKTGGLSYVWPGVQKYKSDVVAKNSAGVTYLMKKNKVAVYNGFGKILGAGKVEVALADGKKETFRPKTSSSRPALSCGRSPDLR